MSRFLLVLFVFSFLCGKSQAVSDTSKAKNSKFRVLAYMRIISDTKGSVRADQNFVPNIKIGKWLRTEAGFRYGEREGNLNAYYHYKLELQTIRFRNCIRALARISDNVINYPQPVFRKTNVLFAVESKHNIFEWLQLRLGAGYVFSTQELNSLEATPVFQHAGATQYPIFKVGFRGVINSKSFVEATYGSYDTFNPYELNRPFVQMSGDYDLSSVCIFTWYLRYQYDNYVFRPFNYFLGLGFILRA